MIFNRRNWSLRLALRWWIAAFFCGALGISAAQTNAPGKVTWRRSEKVFDVAVQNLPIEAFLKKWTHATGWQVYMQPGLEKQVSVEFKNLSQSEAMQMCFADLSYALLPQTNSPSRLYIYQSSLSDATRAVQGERPANWLEKEIVLRLNPEAKVSAEALARQLGGKITGSATNLNAYRVEFPDKESAEAARLALAQNPNGRAEDNYSWTRPNTSPGSSPDAAAGFGLDAKNVATGNELRVALIDTAIQPLDGKMNDFILPSIHLAGEAQPDPASPSHATSMAQHILNSMEGITREGETGVVRIQPYDVYGNKESTTTFDVARALNLAVQSNPAAINLSLGGEGDAPYLEEPLALAARKGIAVFASAGNSPTTDPTYPAASPYTIAVTATDRYGNIAPYANRGDFIDMKAPGSLPIAFNGQPYLSTGTSTATAFMTGQEIALRAKGFNSQEAVQLLKQHYDVNTAPALKK
jgi:hypothetical protein